jgi:hypothetical protein
VSAYAMHIFHDRHEFDPAEESLKLLKPCNKDTKNNCWETLLMNMHYKQDLLIFEQQTTDTNPLFDLAIIPRDLQNTPQHRTCLPGAAYTHTHTQTHNTG